MNQTEFVEMMRLFQVGEPIKLTIRGNYGDYIEIGKLVKVENNERIYLTRGLSHHYRRIRRIDVCTSEEWKKEVEA